VATLGGQELCRSRAARGCRLRLLARKFLGLGIWPCERDGGGLGSLTDIVLDEPTKVYGGNVKAVHSLLRRRQEASGLVNTGDCGPLVFVQRLRHRRAWSRFIGELRRCLHRCAGPCNHRHRNHQPSGSSKQAAAELLIANLDNTPTSALHLRDAIASPAIGKSCSTRPPPTAS
jgi:hypothetical protein